MRLAPMVVSKDKKTFDRCYGVDGPFSRKQ